MEPQIVNYDLPENKLGKYLRTRGDFGMPAMIQNVAVPTVPIWGTQALDDGMLEFDSVVGAVGVTDIETPNQVPEGFVRRIMAAEGSHADAITVAPGNSWQMGIRWTRPAGGATSIALIGNSFTEASEVRSLQYNTIVHLPPTGRMYLNLLTIAASRSATLKYCFVDIPIGGTFPP